MLSIDVILLMDDVYDFAAYRKLCDDNSVQAESFGIFARMIETLAEGVKMFPTLTPHMAYHRFYVHNGFQLFNPEVHDIKEVTQHHADYVERLKCTTCGGGAVL